MTESEKPTTSASPQNVLQPMNTVVMARNRLHEFLKSRMPQLTQWAAGKIDPAALVRFAMVEWQQSERLQRCSPESIYLAIIACAQVGLEPSGVKQEAFIVPYNDRRAGMIATFQPGWRGLIKLALRSGAVRAIVPQLVYDGDEFEIHLGSDAKVIHRPILRGDRGEIIGAYAIAKMANGEIEVEWMALETLERIRASAKRGDIESPAYREWSDQMYRKAPIRRLCKRLPLGEEYFRAAHLDESVETGDLGLYQRTIDAESAPLLGPAEPEPQPTSDERRGVNAAITQLDRRRQGRRRNSSATADTLPPLPVPAIDPQQEEIDAIKGDLGRVTANPSLLPSLRDRLSRVSGDERPVLDRLLADAESVIARARAEDDVPPFGEE